MKREKQIPSSRIERLIKVVYAGATTVDPTKVTEALIDLSPRQHDIVWLHFGLGDDQPRNIGEVAKELGLDPAMVVRSYGASVNKLRHPCRVHKIAKTHNE
jgi:DNA-directed RNA polymerase sigma subunit (sigma70/sigma32)